MKCRSESMTLEKRKCRGDCHAHHDHDGSLTGGDRCAVIVDRPDNQGESHNHDTMTLHSSK